MKIDAKGKDVMVMGLVKISWIFPLGNIKVCIKLFSVIELNINSLIKGVKGNFYLGIIYPIIPVRIIK